MSAALGTTVDAQVQRTVNPLLFRIRFRFGEHQDGRRLMMVWNLFQRFAHRNNSTPQGRVETEGKGLTVEVAVKERLGKPRDRHPAA
jgi:hypothetical protein